MQSRLTIDIDKKKFLEQLIEIYVFRHSIKKLIIKPSIRKGWHIIIWLHKPISNKKHFLLRKRFGDDYNRIRLDKQRLRRKEPINILFNEKKDFYYKRSKEYYEQKYQYYRKKFLFWRKKR